jgi:hypothetical protein
VSAQTWRRQTFVQHHVQNQEIRAMTQSYTQNANDTDEKVTRAVDDAGNKAREMADNATDAVESSVSTIKRKAVDAKDALVSGAGSTLETVKDVAVEKADAARASLSDVGERLAATLERASAESDSDALKSRVLSSVASGLTTASDALRQRSVTDLTSDIKTLAKRHPGAFMAAAAVVGFAAARFVRSSAARRGSGHEL